jgi:hypothetical protein
VDVTSALQAERQRDLYLDQVAQWDRKPPSPLRTAELAALDHAISAYNCTIDYSVAQYDLLRDGTLHPGQNGVVCPFGVYWNGGGKVGKGLYCPAACGNGICATHENNTLACLAQCNSGGAVGCCSNLLFSSSWLNATTADRRLAGRFE